MLVILALLGLAQAAGTVQGIVFGQDGLPASGAMIHVDEQQVVCGPDGAFEIELEAGTHRVRVAGEEVSVEVVDGQITEVLLRPGRDALVEQPPLREVVVAAETGTVAGVVLDDAGQPVAGARVFVRGTEFSSVTDSQGAFRIEAPSGERELSVLMSGYRTAMEPVSVPAGEELSVSVELVKAGLELAELRVVAPRIEGGTADLLEERKESDTVQDVLGAEDMARSGDGDAASALARVTGLTVVGGKYVYVRGLGDRYSSTLLNGSTLPSPEPEKRVVPLDMFPSGMLDSVVIQKAPSPDMPAEFGGGTVLLRTRGVPTEPVVSVGLSGTYRHGTTFQQGLAGPAGPTDWLGFDGGFRDLPANVDAASSESPLEESDMFSDRGYTADELEELGESIENRWKVDARDLPANMGASLTLGGGVQPGRLKLGALGSVGYSNSWTHREFQRDYYLMGAEDQLELGNSYEFVQTNNEVVVSGIGVLAAELGDNHAVRLTSLLNHNNDYMVRSYQGFNRDLGDDLEVVRIQWVERYLAFNQLLGSHTFEALKGVELDWRFARSTAGRTEPDRREWRVDNEPDTEIWYLSDRPEGNGILYSELSDLNHDLGVDLRVPVGPAKIAAGVAGTNKDREVDTRRYKYMHKGEASRDEDRLGGPTDEWFTDDSIGNDGFQFEEITRQTDNYFASQRLRAGYLMASGGAGPLELLAGVRLEGSTQNVTTFELFNPDAEPVVAELKTRDWLPSANATLGLTEKMQLRAGYGKTVSRPDFRELSPATFNDVTGGRQTFGNPELNRAVIHNADLRWELYPTPRESFSVGVFYKRFVDPIEQIVVVSAQHSVTWDNADFANNLGVEIEGRKDLPYDFFVAGNGSLIRSRVVLGETDGIQSSNDRPLQGQSPWVANAQVGYLNPDLGSSVTLLYNVAGPRIQSVGALGAPDTYELPVHRLDLVGRQGLPRGFNVGFKYRNILNSPARRTQGTQQVDEVRDGWSVGLSLGWGL